LAGGSEMMDCKRLSQVGKKHWSYGQSDSRENDGSSVPQRGLVDDGLTSRKVAVKVLRGEE